VDRLILNRSVNQYLKALCSTLVALSMVLSPLVHASMLSMSGQNSTIVSVSLQVEGEHVEQSKTANCHQDISMDEAVQYEVPEQTQLNQAKHVNHASDSSAGDACKAFCTAGVGTLSTSGIPAASLIRHSKAVQFAINSYIPTDSTPLLRPPIL
jgi:hypothetical protein